MKIALIWPTVNVKARLRRALKVRYRERQKLLRNVKSSVRTER